MDGRARPPEALLTVDVLLDFHFFVCRDEFVTRSKTVPF
jgi:hypothetical protein